MRVDVNVTVHHISGINGERVEIKNVGSLKGIEKGIEYEVTYME